MRKFIAAALIFSSGIVTAEPVHWVIDELVLSPVSSFPTVVTGSFSYDADTNQYSNISITASTTYNFINPGSPDFYGEFVPPYSGSDNLFLSSIDPENNGLPLYDDGSGYVVPDWTGILAMNIEFASALTNAGGTVAISFAIEGPCGDPYCSFPDPSKEAYAGSISSVPIPGAAWLFGSALAGLGWIRRKQAV